MKAYCLTHDLQAAETALTEAFECLSTGEDRQWQAELYRLRGEVLLLQAGQISANGADKRHLNHVHGETWFQQALAIARGQQAKSLELRAAMSLAQLWHQQDRTEEAYQLLSPIFHWFTEGFDTPDLQQAKTLLHSLAESLKLVKLRRATSSS